MNENNLAFTGIRHPLSPTAARTEMQNFIQVALSRVVANAGAKEGNHFLDTKDFTTTINNNFNQPTQATCRNYIAALSRKSNETLNEDEPLMILANYDTDSATTAVNPVEDNGSGLAAMLVIAEFISKEIQAGKYELKHSILFVATDCSIYKYVSKDTRSLNYLIVFSGFVIVIIKGVLMHIFSLGGS